MDVIGEAGPDLYRRTGFTIALCSEKYSDGFPLMYAHATIVHSIQILIHWHRTRRFTAGIHALPAYLKKNGYRNPTNPTDTALQLGFNTDLHFFETVKQDPVTAKQFNNHMSIYSLGRPSWMDVGFFPVQERLIEGSNTTNDNVLLIDMGGSIGHDLSEFKRKWPDAPGRLILQDLPTVACHAQGLDPTIEVMPHDFFTPQPVKGMSSPSLPFVPSIRPLTNIQTRRTSILHALCPSRLARRHVPQNPSQFNSSPTPRIQQGFDQRECDPR